MQLTHDQQKEIAFARGKYSATRRPTVPAIEDLLFSPVPILDHGFVRVLDYMGDDGAIVQAARVSYGTGTKQVSDDRGLIRYLMKNRHSTPFEMCEIKFHVKLPIFVARQWIRHRTASVNEYSARYSILDREFYIPEPEHLATQSEDNRQGRGAVVVGTTAEAVFNLLRDDATRNYDHYLAMLSTDNGGPGLSRELARMNLTLNTYTQWYWKVNLHNLFHFLLLRADHHAQHEIRVYARVMLEMTQAWVPIAAEAFQDYQVGAVTLSAQAIEVIRTLLAGKHSTRDHTKMSIREWTELMAVLGRGT